MHSIDSKKYLVNITSLLLVKADFWAGGFTFIFCFFLLNFLISKPTKFVKYYLTKRNYNK